MKKFTVILLLQFAAISLFAQSSKKVLFIGNSYTAVNDLPKLFSDVAISAGDTVIFDSNSPGGFTLQGHVNNAATLEKIKQGNWDFVVLQEQSQYPSFPKYDVENSVFPYARMLDSLINKHNACAETVFYMTWGRKNGDASNCGFWPPVCTYEGMDSLLHLRYMMMANDNKAIASPVGAVWHYIRKNYPAIELYQGDESHPSMMGSYAAACTFYATVFRKNPLLITNNLSLTTASAEIIREVVKKVVYDSLLKWNIGKYDPVAQFDTVSVVKTLAAFKNTSKNASSYLWEFGDGDTSGMFNPTHNYKENGEYTVKLIASHCNYSDTFIQNLIINVPTNIGSTSKGTHEISFYPNPFSNEVAISKKGKEFNNATVILYNAQGSIVKQIPSVYGSTLYLKRADLSTGLYFIQIMQDNRMLMMDKVFIID